MPKITMKALFMLLFTVNEISTNKNYLFHDLLFKVGSILLLGTHFIITGSAWLL